LKGCPHEGSQPLSSYPSGHTLYAFSTGVVLAELMPDKAQAILERDQDFAYSRMVCGVHYRSDLAGGEAMGTLIGRLIVDSPEMQADLAAARAELKAAGLVGG
jgi:membrane-associated phospholipid phosphatase